MTHDPNCIFCKIIEGQIPSAKVYEDEHVMAFLDISQVTKGHTLIIPKNHHKDIFELPSETASHLYSVVPKIARAIHTAFEPAALNILNNNGRAAGQTVFHFHMHLIPRYGIEDGFGLIWEVHDSEYTPDRLQQISGAIAGAIEQE